MRESISSKQLLRESFSLITVIVKSCSIGYCLFVQGSVLYYTALISLGHPIYPLLVAVAVVVAGVAYIAPPSLSIHPIDHCQATSQETCDTHHCCNYY